MKCYRSEGERSYTISLFTAIAHIAKHHEIQWSVAANILERSSAAKTISVGPDVCIWIEDDVPVLDIDRVIEDWWALKVKLSWLLQYLT
jgi:hypothetical protein